jgi:hypothetical protein
MQELDRLREEVERLKNGADAHTTLQAIYRNPASPEGNRIKAAAASLPIEKPKLMPERAPLELTAEVIPLRQLVDARRARADRFWDPLRPSGNGAGNGNGNDEPSDASSE